LADSKAGSGSDSLESAKASGNGRVRGVDGEALRVALPSKGMEQDTLDFFKSCGLSINRTNPRQYRATIPALKNVQVLFQRANDIFAKVDEGSVDLGVTGYDIVREHQYEDDNTVVLMNGLGFGQCALVVAVPEGWIDTTSMVDLAQISADLRSRGRELRVATKYPNLTRQFLYDNGINYFRLVESSGALEAAPQLGYADLIVDLTSSGVTLRENRLKTVVGGQILASQACLIANRQALEASPQKLEQTRWMLELIEGHLRSRDFYSITANIRGEGPEAVARRVTAHSEIAGLRGPTIARVYPHAGVEESWHAVTVIIDSKVLVSAVDALRRAGASDLTVVPVRYVFEARCWSFEALRRRLAGESVEEAVRWP
jgi:ATP phosphoribosyltransferase